MRGFPGQITDNSSPFSGESMILEKSNAPFGVVVVSDSDGVCRLPDKDNILEKGASTGVAVGILILEKSNTNRCNKPLEAPIGSGEINYAIEKSVVTIATTGTIFVETETDVNRNDEIIVNHKMRTSLENLWAVGDMRSEASRQVVCAAADGATAALDIVAYFNSQK